ncbi:unnamed protein product [Musa hybrid cultivar]
MMSSLSINILQIISLIGHQHSPNHRARIIHKRPNMALTKPQLSPVVIATQFLAAMLVLDKWQCFMQTYMHANKSVYKHVQLKHHTLVVPYAFGALTFFKIEACHTLPLFDNFIPSSYQVQHGLLLLLLRHREDDGRPVRAADGRLLLLLCHREDGGRPLRAVAPGQPAACVLQQQQRRL